MNINWFSTKNSSIITVDEKSITLNKYACTYFKDFRYVVVGFNDTKMFIKGVSVLEIDEKKYTTADIFKVTIAATYGRITSIELSKHIFQIINKNKKIKFSCYYNEKTKMLEVDLLKGEDK